jgi:hypothetical protein
VCLHCEAREIVIQDGLAAIELAAPMALGQRVLVDRW